MERSNSVSSSCKRIARDPATEKAKAIHDKEYPITFVIKETIEQLGRQSIKNWLEKKNQNTITTVKQRKRGR